MKKVLKRGVIWFAGIILIVLVMNSVATFFVKEVIYDQMFSLIKYAQKGDALLYPEEYVKTLDEPAKIAAILRLRTLLDDNFVDFNGGIKGDLVCTNLKIDTAVLLSAKNGDTALSSGVWSAVCKEENGEMSPLKDTIGLVSVDALCEMEGAVQLYDILKTNRDARIKLDAYAIKGYVIVPISITVMDNSGKTLEKIECKGVPADYEKIDATDIYIYNVCDDNEFNRADDSLYEEMELAYREERAVDKTASDYLSRITYGGDLSNKSHMKWGFGKFIATDVTVAGDYSMVQVREVSYTKSVVLYCFAFGLLWTIGVFVVILVKKINE